MKKIIYFLFSVLLLGGLMSCEKNKDSKITEAKLIGKWELTSIKVGSQYLHGPEEEIGIMEFTKDHELYCLGEYECDWSLDGNQLSFYDYSYDYFSHTWTITQLTSSTLEVEFPESDGGTTLQVKYTLKRIE